MVLLRKWERYRVWGWKSFAVNRGSKHCWTVVLSCIFKRSNLIWLVPFKISGHFTSINSTNNKLLMDWLKLFLKIYQPSVPTFILEYFWLNIKLLKKFQKNESQSHILKSLKNVSGCRRWTDKQTDKHG